MLNSMRAKHIQCENEAKFIQDRIQLVEKNASEFCTTFAAYSRKAARLRDKFDEIAKASLAYSEAEDINTSLSDGLSNFATSLSSIGDYGDLRVQHIDNKVVGEFAQYESICKNVKEEVKQIYAARDKELNRKKQLDKMRERNPGNRQQILQAETELVKATTEVSKTIHNLEEQITTFERQKLHDIKYILLDFISGEMGYHAKVLELLTKAYQDVQSIDEEADLQEFKKSLRKSETIPRTSKSGLFRATQSLGSIGNLFSTPKKRPTTARLQRNKGLSKSEEVLNSPVRRGRRPVKVSDDEEDEETESESETETEDKSEDDSKSSKIEKDIISPFIARKYLK